jgi:hypothetical protein
VLARALTEPREGDGRWVHGKRTDREHLARWFIGPGRRVKRDDFGHPVGEARAHAGAASDSELAQKAQRRVG